MSIKPVLFTDNEQPHQYHNILYRFYKNLWSDTFKELGSNKNDLASDFCRFDIKLGLFNDLEPLAFHGYQYFDLRLESHRDHPYFNQLKEPLVEKLRSEGIEKVISMEYMCIAPDSRQHLEGNLGQVLGGFTTQYLKDTDADALLTITRNNRNVNKMCKMYGAEAIYEDRELHNVLVDVMAFRPQNVQPNPNPKIRAIIDDLCSQAKKPQTKGIAI